MNKAEKAKAYREELKAEGYCPRCYKRKAVAGKLHCKECEKYYTMPTITHTRRSGLNMQSSGGKNSKLPGYALNAGKGSRKKGFCA